MAKYGFLINYEYCTGCNACEIACRQEHNRPHKDSGMAVLKVTPEQSGGRLYYIPFPTDICNYCARRMAVGLQPACAALCWAQVIECGEIEELAKRVGKRSVLWSPH